jgi:hypothetical protein
MVLDPTTPLTIQSYRLGQCQPYQTASGLQNVVFSMTTDHLTLFSDVYKASNCTGAATTYLVGLQDQTQGCKWSYTTNTIPAMAQSPTTLAAVNDWVVTSYYTTAAACAAKQSPQYVYQAQVAVTVPCISTCTLNSNGNGFYQVVQNCVYNPLFTPTGAPVPTAAPTQLTENMTAIIAGSVVGGILLLALLAGLYFCCMTGGAKDEDEFERLRTDRP